MANIYVRSTDGNNADNGSTWALAKANIVGAGAIDASGDDIWLSQSHAESTAGNVSYSGNGIVSSPVRIMCGNDAAQPPTALATTASIATTGSGSISMLGEHYVYGVSFNAGSGASTTTIVLGNTDNLVQKYESCKFVINATNPASQITTNARTIITWVNCDLKFASTGQTINMSVLDWTGGSLLSGGTSPDALFSTSSSTAFPCRIRVENVDLSNAGAGICLIKGVAAGGEVVFRNCKLPSSWSGTVVTGTTNPRLRASLYNCDAGATNYKLWVSSYAGDIRSETTLVRSGGASDGATTLSWKMTSFSIANQLYPLVSDEIVAWISQTGVSKTVEVEILHDSSTNLKDNEIWLELTYLGSSGAPLGTRTHDTIGAITAGSDQTSSSATWTTTGMTNPNKQKLAVTFTPNLRGFVIARVVLAKPSKTVYVDPKLIIT